MYTFWFRNQSKKPVAMHDPVPGLSDIETVIYIEGKKVRRGVLYVLFACLLMDVVLTMRYLY